MVPARFKAIFLTCPARCKTLAGTLRALKETDWSAGYEIQMDTSNLKRLQKRQSHNSLALLQRGLADPEWDYLLFFEDDLIFNRHLQHNLEQWHPIQSSELNFGSLYNPTIRARTWHRPRRYFLADPDAVYGSQAFIMSRPCAEFIVEHYFEVDGMQDIKCSRLAARFGSGLIHYHLPSLVQHDSSAKSTWGGCVHTTHDYDQDFKA